MKRWLLFTLIAGFAGIACVVTLWCVPSLYLKEPATEETPSIQGVSCSYVLTLSNGFVAVKQIGKREPCVVYDLPETMLSAYDRALLQDGILCSSVEEAQRLAADFVA